jgi:hypothetical protein
MDNNITSPPPAARVSQSNSGEDKSSEDRRPLKPLKHPAATSKKGPAAPEIESGEREEKHKLDELA